MAFEQFQDSFEQAFRLARRVGFSVKEIRERLLSQGYDESILSKLILKYYIKKTAKITVFTLSLILLLLLLTYFLLPEACETPSCFIKAANECESRTYYNEEAGSLIKYTISSDCLLIKRVIEVGISEPQRVRDAFLGKLMVCEFPNNEFNPGFFKLAWGLEYCEGPLKDAILSILSAVCPEPCGEAVTLEEASAAIEAQSPLLSEAEELVKTSYLPYAIPPIFLLLVAYYYYKKKQK